MKKRFLLKALFTALFTLLLTMVGKVNAQTYSFNPIKAETVGIIPYSDDFTTYDEVVERNYAITSFKMLDTATVAVLTGASDMILVYSLMDNQVLYRIKLPISVRAFDYNDGVFHAVGDRTYLSVDKNGIIQNKVDFKKPDLDFFVINDLLVSDGRPIVHECNVNTFQISSNGLQEIDTFFYHYEGGYKLHPNYNNGRGCNIVYQTPSRVNRTIGLSVDALGLEGKIACIHPISIDSNQIALNIQTGVDHPINFAKSYLVILDLQGKLINKVELPINFISWISNPLLPFNNSFYYAFSGEEGVTFYKIDKYSNMVVSPDSYDMSEISLPQCSGEPVIIPHDTDIMTATRGNWRTATQVWENSESYCDLEWTPNANNLAPSCTPVSNGYIITPNNLTAGYTETGVPYKWSGFTRYYQFKELASQNKYTGNIRTSSNAGCNGNVYQSISDAQVIGVDCSGFVCHCWEHGSHVWTGAIPDISSYIGTINNYNTYSNTSLYQTGDALNWSDGNNCNYRHVMMYAYHNPNTGDIHVFESTTGSFNKTTRNCHDLSYFQGHVTCSGQTIYRTYQIRRYNYMKDIRLRLGSAISLSQNNTPVANVVTQGQPLTVNYSVTNAGSETWTGYVRLYIEQSNGDLWPIGDEYYRTISAGDTKTFSFSNEEVISPVGTSKLFVKVKNNNASDYQQYYNVGDGNYSNPKVFQIVEGGHPGPGTGECKDCPEYDEIWNITGDGEWSTKSSSIGTDGCRLYRIYMPSSYTYTFKTCGEGNANFDTRLYLYDASCNEVADDDDGCTGTLSLLEYTNTGNAAYYYLKIDGFSGEGGSFTIAGKREASASPCSDCPDYDELWSISGDGEWTTQSSTIASEGCHVYKVRLNANYTYTFKTCGEGNANFDTRLWLYDASCNDVTDDDDSCTGTLSLLEYTNTGNTAYYYLKIDGYNGAGGTYTLAAKRESPTTNYTITASANPTAGGTVSGGGTYAQGSSATVTATANSGYTFTNWTENGSVVSTNGTYTFQVNGNRTLVAHFSQNSYTVSTSANPTAGGTVSGGGTYAQGSSATVTATANSGYTFTNWTESGSVVSTSPTYSFTVNGNRTLVAHFSQNSYTVSASANPTAGGTVSGGGTYAQGSNATVTATANSGYTFTNWTESGSVVSTSPTYSFTVNGNRTLVAHFSQNSYTVSASANPTAGGTVSGGGTYAQGSNATVTATANSGYTFTNWTENGSVVSSNGTYTFQVNGNRTLVANFEAQGGQITNHYLPVSQGSSGSMVITGVIQINGIEQASDQLELGVFCGNECRGASIAHPFTLVQPNYYMVDPVIYGDTGDSYTFKLYDHSIGQELNYTSPEAVAFNENGYGNAFNPYNLNFMSTVTVTQPLALGWNWWSSYIEASGAEGLGMLENSLGDACIRIQSRNQYVDNYGTFWYGTLTEINNKESYRIRTNQSCTATLVGMEASPSNHPISVNPGWNWVGFPCAEYVSLSTAMDNFNPEVNDQLKSRHQYCSYIGNNQWYGTLQTLEPGQGYMYKSNASGTKTLVYQTGREESLMANVTTERNFFTPVCEDYADNMTLTAVVEVEGAELRSGDYEVAAFVGDQCRGSVKLMYVEPVDRHVAFLLAYGDAEEDMRFVLTDGTEAVLSGDVIRFSANGTVGTVADPVVLHFGTWGMNDEPQAVVNVFPNPSKDVFNVEGSGIRKVDVVDMWGQRILAKETKGIHMQVDLGGKAAGIYLLRVVTANGTITRQLIKED